MENFLFLTNISLFSVLAPILGQRPQLLHVAVGGSVLIPCSLPGYPHNLKWFYWQEDEYLVFHWDGGKTIPVQNNKYKDRYQVFNSEFSSGNISIRLDNISPEDDQKTFFAYVKFYDEQKKVFKHPEEWCRSMLQVSGKFRSFFMPNCCKCCKCHSCSFCHTHSSLPGSGPDG